MPRDVLKKRFLTDVIAKKKVGQRRVEYPSTVEDVFKGLFPNVYRFIREFNNGGWDHANLIRELQRQESSLVIGVVAADLIERHPDLFIITLHDAIYTTPDGVAQVEQAFERAFDATGFRMTLKVGAA